MILPLLFATSSIKAYRKVSSLRPGGKQKSPFTGSNSRPISLLPTLSKLLEKIVFDQCYFSVNKLTTDFQHTYKEGRSTITTLRQMTDDWLREIDYKTIVGSVLLDFSAALNIIDPSLLMEKLTVCVMTLHHLL